MTFVDIVSKIIIPVLSLLGVGVIMKNFWEDRRQKKKEASQEEKEKRKKERQDEIREVLKETIIPRLELLEEDNKLLKKSNQASLRDRLYDLSDECIARGYATNQEKENFENLYQNYHNLGKNGVMDNIHKDFIDLPSDVEYFSNEKAGNKK